MELFKLDSSYLPGPTIRPFKSLVWTERFDVAGDFELIVENDISILSKIPPGTLISHSSTLEVMMVEEYEIQRNEDRTVLITIKGRSFETFAENRVTAYSELPLETAGEANIEILSGVSSGEAAITILKYSLEPGTATTDDEIPNLLVVDGVTVHDDAMDYVVERGDIYNRVLDFLKINNLGIKTVRPNGIQTTLNLVVHDGIDKTLLSIFSAANKDLKEATYFKSIEKYKNYANVAGKDTSRLYRHRNLLTDRTGLNRRVIYVGESSIEGLYDPPSDTDVIAAFGQMTLDENKQLFLIHATIVDDAKPKFKIDYEIGDYVSVYGEFNTVTAMQVVEYIFTADEDGMKGYPTLKEINVDG